MDKITSLIKQRDKLRVTLQGVESEIFKLQTEDTGDQQVETVSIENVAKYSPKEDIRTRAAKVDQTTFDDIISRLTDRVPIKIPLFAKSTYKLGYFVNG